MSPEVQNKVRQPSTCLKHHDGKQKEVVQKHVLHERLRQQMMDPALFMKVLIKQRSAPPTEVVHQGQLRHRFSFSFPVVIKPFDGSKMILARNQSEIESAVKTLRTVGYQIQKYLEGYQFLKVRIENGFLAEGYQLYVSGAVRSLVKLYVSQGILDFTLTVATDGITTYIIGGRVT